MVLIHYGHIPDLSTQAPSITKLGEFEVLFLETNKKKLDHLKKIFTKSKSAITNLDNHVFDVILPILNDHESFCLYLLLYRLSDKKLIITDINELSQKLNTTKPILLKSLATLEENLLIKITGNKLLKIELNQNWIE